MCNQQDNQIRIIENHGLLDEVQIFAGVMACIFTLVGVIGNLLMIAALIRKKTLRKQVTTKLIISLAVSDFLFCSINTGSNAVQYFTKNNPNCPDNNCIWGDKICEVFAFFYFANGGASLGNLWLITINQYVMVCHYSKHDRIYTKCNIGLMLAFVWSSIFGLNLLPLLEIWGKIEPHAKKYSCTIVRTDKDDPWSSPLIFFLFFAFGCPCIVIIYGYIAIIRKLKRTRAALMRTLNANTLQREIQDHQRQWRMIKMMLLVFCCFIFTFLPSAIINFVDQDYVYPNVHVFMDILWWSASVINPVIYMIRNLRYREAMIELLRKMFCLPQKHQRKPTKIPTINSHQSASERTKGPKRRPHSVGFSNNRPVSLSMVPVWSGAEPMEKISMEKNSKFTGLKRRSTEPTIAFTCTEQNTELTVVRQDTTENLELEKSLKNMENDTIKSDMESEKKNMETIREESKKETLNQEITQNTTNEAVKEITSKKITEKSTENSMDKIKLKNDASLTQKVSEDTDSKITVDNKKDEMLLSQVSQEENLTSENRPVQNKNSNSQDKKEMLDHKISQDSLTTKTTGKNTSENSKEKNIEKCDKQKSTQRVDKRFEQNTEEMLGNETNQNNTTKTVEKSPEKNLDSNTK